MLRIGAVISLIIRVLPAVGQQQNNPRSYNRDSFFGPEHYSQARRGNDNRDTIELCRAPTKTTSGEVVPGPKHIIKCRRNGVYRLSDAARAAFREGIDAAEAGHFAPEDEMDEFYRLHRNP